MTKSICIRAAIALLASGLFLVGPSGAETGAPPVCAATRDQLIAAIRSVHDKQRNLGVQAAINLNGRIVFSVGLGTADRARNIPVTANTVFPVASVTKAFTGIAALRAEAEGSILLDTPIQTYVPEFPVKPELVITPRRLAAHRSGIHHWGAGIDHWGVEREALYSRHFSRLADILPLFANDPLRANAGEEYQYSSLGYNLLALAVERATGTKFTDYVQQQILTPLRLSNTRFDDVNRPTAGLTRLYSFYDLRTFAELAEPITVPELDYSHNMAGGNMSTTSEDLVTFGAALFHPGLLPPHQYELLFEQPTFGGRPSPMTFGFFAQDAGSERLLRINGANPGMMSALSIYPDRKLSVAVLANTWGIGSRSGEMTSELPRRLADLCAPPRAPQASVQ